MVEDYIIFPGRIFIYTDIYGYCRKKSCFDFVSLAERDRPLRAIPTTARNRIWKRIKTSKTSIFYCETMKTHICLRHICVLIRREQKSSPRNPEIQ